MGKIRKSLSIRIIWTRELDYAITEKARGVGRRSPFTWGYGNCLGYTVVYKKELYELTSGRVKSIFLTKSSSTGSILGSSISMGSSALQSVFCFPPRRCEQAATSISPLKCIVTVSSARDHEKGQLKV